MSEHNAGKRRASGAGKPHSCILLDFLKVFLRSTAHGTYPIVGQCCELGARLYPTVGISLGLVVDVTTDLALPFLESARWLYWSRSGSWLRWRRSWLSGDSRSWLYWRRSWLRWSGSWLCWRRS